MNTKGWWRFVIMARIVFENPDVLVIDLERKHLALSTAGCPKVYKELRYVVFKKVPKNFEIVDLDSYCKEIALSINLNYDETSIFLTAVDVSTYSHSLVKYRGIEAEAFVTFGVDTPACLDVEKNVVGTINLALIVNKPLNIIGLLDLYRLASEVKGMVMALGGPMCKSITSIGTASDATMVLAPVGEERFAGIATDVGIASTMAIISALSKHIRKTPVDKYVSQTLGFKDINDVIEIALEVYSKASLPQLSIDNVKNELMQEIEKVLKDPNIVVFLRGMRLAEAALALGLVPGIGKEEYRLDSTGIVVDELAGKAVAEYINGFKGLLSYYWVERLKKENKLGILNELPPIADDLIGAFVGAILSRIYDKYSR
ncbi:adenosylcobinamide amidohydrolase [Ignisphaera sp. 4213-co]|uniref:Adenosylcobinamide amidohydrolase n=1 Tax=Ignisphaera cupida TaxID=3050454 RepID=A0ABD4Z4T9_9CREN|nr:adenosylcobinamide amidohydrolase [Ignisphaera sp. 4213-co]MDK6028321.1 adenosylcobinamide amidohydrolase [Ignisphaera sp. 4213-co]